MKIRVGHLYPDYLNIYADRGNIAVLAERARRARPRARGDARSGSATPMPPGDRPLLHRRRAGPRAGARRATTSPAKARGARARRPRAARRARRLRRLPAARPRLPRRRTASELPGDRAPAARDGRRRAADDRRRAARLRLGRARRSPASRTTPAGRSSTPGPSRSAASSPGSATTACPAPRGAAPGRVYGTYLHGPLLPRNPWFADWLLAEALAHSPARQHDARRRWRTSSSARRTPSPPSARAAARRPLSSGPRASRGTRPDRPAASARGSA